MKSHIQTDFNAKFSLLNSQENTELIIWSCDSSSDYDNYIETKSKSIYRKRKRKPSKKLDKNISNLDITITDATQERKLENNNKSPILKPKSSKTKNYSKEPTSPIIISKKAETVNARSKSPILALRSRPSSSNISKKLLFHTDVSEAPSIKERCFSPIVNKSTDETSFITIQKEQLNISNENEGYHGHKCSDNDLQSKTNLIEKVRSYFKSNFSSDSLSQNSISEYDTPKNSSKTSEEIEITDLSQGLPLPIKKEHSSPFVSSSEEVTEKSKKVKYKKEGLAFRLNILLKKQNANISLWQHEQYLAANSNFVMPKSAYVTFRIKKVDFKFGCFLLLAINDKDEVFLILINNLFVKNKIETDVILKLYEPYQILHFNEKYKLIVNACKFVCLPFSLN